MLGQLSNPGKELRLVLASLTEQPQSYSPLELELCSAPTANAVDLLQTHS